MSILPKKPSDESVSLKDVVGRLVEDSFFLPQALLAYWNGDRTVPIDVYEEGSHIVVKATLPGIKAEDLNIEVRENILTISGQVQQETERKEEDYFINERRYGQFRRAVVLPYDVKVDEVEAEFEDGILTLTLPKAETAKGKKVAIKSKAKAEKPASKAEKPEAKTEQQRAKTEKPKAKTGKSKAKAENPEAKAE